jgi:hypothetical protein
LLAKPLSIALYLYIYDVANPIGGIRNIIPGKGEY